MMSWRIISVALAVLLVCHGSDGCIQYEDVFKTAPPENVTVSEGTTVNLSCRANSQLVFNYRWDYIVGGSRFTFDSMNPEYGLRVTTEGNASILTIPNVGLELNEAVFECILLDRFFNNQIRDQICNPPSGMPSRRSTIFIKASPAITDLSPSSPNVRTQQNLTVTARVTGNPAPEVSLYAVTSAGGQVEISPQTHPRVMIQQHLNGELSIVFSLARRADQGMYKIVADNKRPPMAELTFSLDVTGVDPPEVSVGEYKVASYGSPVHLFCSVQPDGYNSSTVIQWKDTQGNVVSTATNQDVFAVDFSNGTVRLTIGSLSSSLVGEYRCVASNGLFSDNAGSMVYGPPPTPSPQSLKFSVDSSDQSVTIRWTRPQESTIITQYRVRIYVDGSSGAPVRTMDSVMYPTDHNSGSVVITKLEPGSYEYTVTAISNGIVGEEGSRQSFMIEAEPFNMTLVIGAAAGGFVFIVILLVVAILTFYCCCKYYVRRKGNSSHQQWNSDEEKMPGHPQVAPVMNTYTTALALDSQCDLPPSPMSPMTSAMGIDPKWEFPRENITLQDELAVGQFTVLYKATARGLRDNRACDVTVKALREGATEDDLKVLIYEMDMLATIEEHPNIVSLLRVCSVGKPVFMIMEYMCHGDLLGFLRSCRNYRGMYSVSPGPRYQPPALQLCSRDLINMATKIANAMRFLADRKIVHRALCARNILVGTGMDVKVYNIGSFDIPVDSGDSLAKWMAPETLFDGTNTTYSDVWSFGVTMWELITIGGTPYHDIPTEELYSQLQGGMRMACPPHCAQEVYDIVSACWEKNPLDRPHFAIIHENLDELLMSKLSYLDLRSYNGQAYSQFDQSLTKSTPL